MPLEETYYLSNIPSGEEAGEQVLSGLIGKLNGSLSLKDSNYSSYVPEGYILRTGEVNGLETHITLSFYKGKIRVKLRDNNGTDHNHPILTNIRKTLYELNFQRFPGSYKR